MGKQIHWVMNTFHPLEYDDEEMRLHIIGILQNDLVAKVINILADGQKHTVRFDQAWTKEYRMSRRNSEQFEEYNKIIMSIIVDEEEEDEQNKI